MIYDMKSKELNIIINELCRTSDCISDAQIHHLIHQIRSHARIFVHAAGRSGLMLRAFAMRLMQMGLQSFVVGETTTPAIGSGDLLFLASASGTTRSVCEYAEYAKKNSIDTVVITANGNSPLCTFPEPTVLIHAGSKISSLDSSIQPMGSLFEQMLLLLSDAVILCMDSDTEEMNARHANLE